MLRLAFDTTIIAWRGPSPFVFAPVRAVHAGAMGQISRQVSYGWGMIPVKAEIGGVAFTTSLFPRDGTYLLPLKLAVRRKTGLTVGDGVTVG